MDKLLSNVIKAAVAAIVVTMAAQTVAPYWRRWQKKNELQAKLKVVKDKLTKIEEQHRMDRMFVAMDEARRKAGIPVTEN